MVRQSGIAGRLFVACDQEPHHTNTRLLKQTAIYRFLAIMNETMGSEFTEQIKINLCDKLTAIMTERYNASLLFLLCRGSPACIAAHQSLRIHSNNNTSTIYQCSQH